MKPIKFEEANAQYAKDQPPYVMLPAFVDPKDPDGAVVFCIQLSLVERLRLLVTGKLWCALLMGQSSTLTPSFFTTKKSDVITSEV